MEVVGTHLFCGNWRAKRALIGDEDGKLRIAVHGYIYIYMCHTLITRRVHGKFYGLNLKEEMVVLENLP